MSTNTTTPPTDTESVRAFDEAELRPAITEFHDLHAAKCAADAAEVRLLARVYATAEDRYAGHPRHRNHDGVIDPTTFERLLRSLAGDFAVATTASDYGLASRAAHAHELLTRFPDWVDALAAARIDYPRTRAVTKHAGPVPADALAEYSRNVLAYASKNSVGKTDRFAEREAARLAANDLPRAHTIAREARGVSIRHDEHAMSTLFVRLETHLAVPIYDLLTQQAIALQQQAEQECQAALTAGRPITTADAFGRPADPAASPAASGSSASASGHDSAVSGSGDDSATDARPAARDAAPFTPDTRTLDQYRADLFADTLLTATPQQILDSPDPGAPRITANVAVTVPVLSLLHESHAATAAAMQPRTITIRNTNGEDIEYEIHDGDPALLDGMHPISPDVAREFLGEATQWQRLLTNPINGHPHTVDSYEPALNQRRFLRLRDRVCRFPGCRRTAQRDDLDHTIPASEGGPTADDNLCHLCRTHHVQKTSRRVAAHQPRRRRARMAHPTRTNRCHRTRTRRATIHTHRAERAGRPTRCGKCPSG